MAMTALEKTCGKYFERYHFFYRGKRIEASPARFIMQHLRTRHELAVRWSDPLPSKATWYALFVSPGRELKILNELRRDGYTAWYPVVAEYKVHMAPPASADDATVSPFHWAASERFRILPLIPSYVFVAGPPDQTLASDWLYRVLYPDGGSVRRQHVWKVMTQNDTVMTYTTGDLRAFESETPPIPLKYGSSVVLRASAPYPTRRGRMGVIEHLESTRVAGRGRVWVRFSDGEILTMHADHVLPARFIEGSIVAIRKGPLSGRNGYLLRDYDCKLEVALDNYGEAATLPIEYCAVDDTSAPAADDRPMPPLVEQLRAYTELYIEGKSLTGRDLRNFQRLLTLWRADGRTVRTASRQLLDQDYHHLSRENQSRLRRAFGRRGA